MMPAPALPPDKPSVFRRALVKVMVMQVVALVLLWLLQARYTP